MQCARPATTNSAFTESSRGVICRAAPEVEACNHRRVPGRHCLICRAGSSRWTEALAGVAASHERPSSRRWRPDTAHDPHAHIGSATPLPQVFITVVMVTPLALFRCTGLAMRPVSTGAALAASPGILPLRKGRSWRHTPPSAAGQARSVLAGQAADGQPLGCALGHELRTRLGLDAGLLQGGLQYR